MVINIGIKELFQITFKFIRRKTLKISSKTNKVPTAIKRAKLRSVGTQENVQNLKKF